jgi:hypothetical protein
MPHRLSGADCLRLALPSTFQEHIFFGWRFFFQQQTSFNWRFFFQPFSSRLPAAGASFNLSRARFFWLAHVSLLRFRPPTVRFSRLRSVAEQGGCNTGLGVAAQSLTVMMLTLMVATLFVTTARLRWPSGQI